MNWQDDDPEIRGRRQLEKHEINELLGEEVLPIRSQPKADDWVELRRLLLEKLG